MSVSKKSDRSEDQIQNTVSINSQTRIVYCALVVASHFKPIYFYADTLKVSSGALIEVTLLFRYSTTDREATRVLALFGHLSEWQFN